MGGNISLKYLGEEATNVDSRINKTVAISTPLSLQDCARSLSTGFSKVYTKHFILRMVRKLAVKKKQFSDFNPNLKELRALWDFESFDNRITAPINGFNDAKDYWSKASSLQFLPHIKSKTLIINAKNDPFLSGDCYPYEVLRGHPHVDFETPEAGGHVGFAQKNLKDVWTETRVLEFLQG